MHLTESELRLGSRPEHNNGCGPLLWSVTLCQSRLVESAESTRSHALPTSMIYSGNSRLSVCTQYTLTVSHAQMLIKFAGDWLTPWEVDQHMAHGRFQELSLVTDS
jgi:hypothetical protein